MQHRSVETCVALHEIRIYVTAAMLRMSTHVANFMWCIAIGLYVKTVLWHLCESGWFFDAIIQ